MPTRDLAETPQGAIALRFARALVEGDYEAAHGALADGLKVSQPPEKLREEFESMIAYGSGRPEFVAVMNTLDDWPEKQPGDVGWASVAISGDGFSESLTVVVAAERSHLVIRDLEWGRP